jgi:hypothetical protein
VGGTGGNFTDPGDDVPDDGPQHCRGDHGGGFASILQNRINPKQAVHGAFRNFCSQQGGAEKLGEKGKRENERDVQRTRSDNGGNQISFVVKAGNENVKKNQEYGAIEEYNDNRLPGSSF